MSNEFINEFTMTASRPYMVRALYEWIVDNQLTPHLVLDATIDLVRVPTQYVKDGKIVLNISPDATDNLVLSNHGVEFEASFDGVVEKIYAPIQAVTAIYAHENGHGRVFEDDEDDGEFESPPPPTGGGKPQLRIVK